ncbi:MAG: DUF1871 family protein [Saccharofermentanales bacterium]
MDFSKVKKIIDNWDPIELLAMHCPQDEYDDISKEIGNSNIIDANELGNFIYSAFSKSFHSNIFTKDLWECIDIANKILKNKDSN